MSYRYPGEAGPSAGSESLVRGPGRCQGGGFIDTDKAVVGAVQPRNPVQEVAGELLTGKVLGSQPVYASWATDLLCIGYILTSGPGRLFDHFGDQVEAVFDGGGDGLKSLAAIVFGNFVGSQALDGVQRDWPGALHPGYPLPAADPPYAQDIGNAPGDFTHLFGGDVDTRQLRYFFYFVLLYSHVSVNREVLPCRQRGRKLNTFAPCPKSPRLIQLRE